MNKEIIIINYYIKLLYVIAFYKYILTLLYVIVININNNTCGEGGTRKQTE